MIYSPTSDVYFSMEILLRKEGIPANETFPGCLIALI